MDRSVCHNWGWILAFGVASTILGTFAIISPFVATLAGVITLGAILITFGVVEFVQVFTGKIPHHKILNIALGILTAVAGLMLIYNPLAGALSLTLFIATFLIVIGVFKIIFALARKYSNWGWILCNGIINIILGILIYYQWPVSGLWVIGLFIGIDLIMYGWALIGFALRLRTMCNELD